MMYSSLMEGLESSIHYSIKIGSYFFRKTIISHFMFSLHFMLFPTYLENKFVQGEGGGCKQNVCGVSF